MTPTSDRSKAVKSRSLIDNYNGRHQHHQEQHQQSRRSRWPDVVAGVGLNTIINYSPVWVWDSGLVGWDILFIIKVEARRWNVLISSDNLSIISPRLSGGMRGWWRTAITPNSRLENIIVVHRRRIIGWDLGNVEMRHYCDVTLWWIMDILSS